MAKDAIPSVKVSKKPFLKNKIPLYLILIGLAVIVVEILLLLLAPKKMTGLEIASEEIKFVDQMRIQTPEGEIFGKQDCSGALERASENQFAPAAWSFLAYASLYDSTQDPKYIASIRTIESKIKRAAEYINDNKEYPEFAGMN
jgi:hypothetical protein